MGLVPIRVAESLAADHLFSPVAERLLDRMSRMHKLVIPVT